MRKSMGMILAVLLAVAGPAGTVFGQTAPTLNDGVYTAAGQGKDGPITVRTTVKYHRLAKVEVVSQTETKGVADTAAAVTAAEGGARVIVLEKAAQPGGATLMASGPWERSGVGDLTLSVN